MSKSLVEMAADIVKAQCTSTSMSAEDITSSLQNRKTGVEDRLSSRSTPRANRKAQTFVTAAE